MLRSHWEKEQIEAKKVINYFEDNQGAIDLSKSPKEHNQTKHIDFCYHFIRERVSSKEISVEYCPAEYMLADIMTKALPKFTFKRFKILSV